MQDITKSEFCWVLHHAPLPDIRLSIQRELNPEPIKFLKTSRTQDMDCSENWDLVGNRAVIGQEQRLRSCTHCFTLFWTGHLFHYMRLTSVSDKYHTCMYPPFSLCIMHSTIQPKTDLILSFIVDWQSQSLTSELSIELTLFKQLYWCNIYWPAVIGPPLPSVISPQYGMQCFHNFQADDFETIQNKYVITSNGTQIMLVFWIWALPLAPEGAVMMYSVSRQRARRYQCLAPSHTAVGFWRSSPTSPSTDYRL